MLRRMHARITASLVGLTTIALTSSALAHEGHGSHGNTLLHYLTDPFHVGMAIASLAVCGVLFRIVRVRARDDS